MTYTVLPNSGQSLGVTRIPINTNFSLIQSVFALNHVGFNSGANSGKHKFVQMPAQATSPGTAAAETAIYSRTALVGSSNETNMYWQFPGTAAAGADVVMTRFITPSLATNGITFLPGGLIMQWGTVNAPGGLGTVFFMPAPQVTFPTAILSVQLTGRRDGNDVSFSLDGAPTTSAFGYRADSGSAQSLFWIAIGY